MTQVACRARAVTQGDATNVYVCNCSVRSHSQGQESTKCKDRQTACQAPEGRQHLLQRGVVRGAADHRQAAPQDALVLALHQRERQVAAGAHHLSVVAGNTVRRPDAWIATCLPAEKLSSRPIIEPGYAGLSRGTT